MLMVHNTMKLVGGGLSLMAAVWASSSSSSVAADADSRNSDGANTNMGIGVDVDNGNGLLTFPLLSHDHVVERRRRELLADGYDIDPTRHRLDHDRIPLHRGGVDDSEFATGDGGHDHRSLSNLKQQIGALYQGYGTHYMDLWVGYPSQRQTVIVDTGSSVSVFPCSTCVNCGSHTDPPFNELLSESFIAKVCTAGGDNGGCIFGTCMDNGSCLISRTIETSSQDSSSSTAVDSWTAYEAEDIVYAAGLHDEALDSPVVDLNPDDPANAIKFSFPLTFGCQISTSGYFAKQLASGVMGLDRRGQSFWGQMRASQLISHSQFSLCFGNPTPYGSVAGVVTLGGVDKRLHKTPMVFANSAGDRFTTNYKVQVRKMYLREGNDMSVMNDVTMKYHLVDASMEWLNGEQMFNLESATTDTYFIKSLSGAFRNLWLEITGMEFTNEPMAMGGNSGVDLLKLPTIVMQIIPHNGGIGDEVQTGDPREVNGLAGIVDMSTPNDVLLAIPPQHYMQNNKDGTFTPRIYLDRDNALGNVLGANAMMGHDVMFDLEVGRIGFSESDCDYARLIAGGGEDAAVDVDNNEDGLLAAQQTSDTNNNSILCTSNRCFGLFAFTMILILFTCFLFARRYVNRQDNVTSGDSSIRDIESSSEFEMQLKSSQNKHPRGDMSYSDGSSRYRDTPSSHSSSNGSIRSSDASGSRKDQYINRDGERGSHYTDEPRRQRYHDRRRSSRESDDGGDFRSSTQSVHTHSSGTSGSSEGSRETRQSSRTHNSSRSLGTHHSVRSSASRQSTRSSASRQSSATKESHRTSGSSSSRRSQYDDGRSRYSDREYGHERSSSRRYGSGYEDDDDLPRPPSIS
jgi:hypothetical protein